MALMTATTNCIGASDRPNRNTVLVNAATQCYSNNQSIEITCYWLTINICNRFLKSRTFISDAFNKALKKTPYTVD